MGHARRHIPNRLKVHRIEAGYSQREVARLLGHKNPSLISSWENGFSYPSTPNLFKLSILYATLSSQLYFDLHQAVRKELSHERDEVIIKRTKKK